MKKLFLTIRSLAFYIGYILVTIIWGTISCLVIWPFPYNVRFKFIIGVWTRSVLLLLKVFCRVSVDVRGLENIPAGPFLAFSKHESPMETYFLQSLLAPITTVIKRELVWIPFFGWAFGLVKPILIDRSRKVKALRSFLAQGKDRLENGISVLIFPEGSRTQPGELSKFQSGAAALAKSTGVPILPVFHNSGSCWPRGHLSKQPGIVKVVIGKPIFSHQPEYAKINETVRNWMKEQAELDIFQKDKRHKKTF